MPKLKLKSKTAIVALLVATFTGTIVPANAEKVYVSDTQNFWIAYTSKSECDQELGANCDIAQSCGPYTVYMTRELADRILNEMNLSTRHTFSVGSFDNEVCNF